MSIRTSHSPDTARADPHDAALLLVRDALDRLKFGAVHLTIHEGRLVQIEVTEKTRLTAGPTGQGRSLPE